MFKERTDRPSNEVLLRLLEESGGNITEISRKINVPRSTVRLWINQLREGKSHKGVLKKTVNIVHLTDFHYPYHNENCLKVSLKFLRDLNPNIIILDEVFDWYQLSKFNKDPKRTGDLQKDADGAHNILKKYRDCLPKARIIMIKSNHDERLQKYLWSNAPALASLRCLTVSELLRLKDLDIEYLEDFTYGIFLFKHGNLVSKHSALTAMGEYLKEGMSGSSGHTHRLGVYYVTKKGGKYVWLESGCMCRTSEVEYIEGTANWQNGFSHVTFCKDRFYAEVIPIIDDKIIHGKKLYTSED